MKIFLLFLLVLVLNSCEKDENINGNDNGDEFFESVQSPTDGIASFTVAPFDLSQAGSVTALGHITGGGHVQPTPHAYIYQWDLLGPTPTDPAPPVNIYAPATGIVVFTINPNSSEPTDWKIMFKCTQSFFYYLDHVITTSPPGVGAIVHAGDLLGQTNGSALDVGAIDAEVTLTGFANPARYSFSQRHCVTPWQYFVEPIKSALYAKMYRAPGASPDARIDQDVPGTLAGTWFEQSLPVDPEIVESSEGWPKTISFALDEYDGSSPRVSCGGWPTITPSNIGNVGLVWRVPSSLSSWSDISVASGFQEIPLLNMSGTSQVGLLTLQMISADRIKIEIWPGSQAAHAAFDAGALFYVR